MNLEFKLVVLGMVLIFAGMSWGLYDIYKNFLAIKTILKEIQKSLESMI